MSFHDDQDLEARLRRISAGPELDPPASVYRHLNEVANGDGTRSIDGVQLSRVRLGRGRSRARFAGALAAVAAALVIAVSAAGLLVVMRGPQATATWTLRPDAGQGEWTGLEWHDITALAGGLAGGLAWSPSGKGGVVRWRGGFAAVGGDYNLWLSSDGLTWKRAAGAPRFPGIVAVGGDLLAVGQDSGGHGPWLWRTTDGLTWTRISVPFDVSYARGLTAGGPGVVAVTNYINEFPVGLSGIYFSTDARTWAQATLPSDLAAAFDVFVYPFVDGFVAVGLVSDPNGSMSESISGPSGTITVRERSQDWISRDGMTWTTYDPVVPSTEVQGTEPQMNGMQVGRLGAGDGRIHSNDGGATWRADADQRPDCSPYCGQTVSDGTRIVSAVSPAKFYLSEGDGHWRQLEQGGDVGSLPADGQMMLLPNGVLWIAGNRVYFGQALSGVAPEGSLGPPTTASPGPSVVQAVPTTTPVAEPTLTPEPTPTAQRSKSP